MYFDYIYRAISHPVTYVALRFGLRPNHLTAISIGASVVAGIFSVIRPDLIVVTMGIFVFSYLFDFCDGNAARVFIKKNLLSEVDKMRGLLFENLNTNISLLAMYIGLGVHFMVVSATIPYFDPVLVGLFAWFVFGIKMISRYSLRQGYVAFKKYKTSLAPGKAMMEKYKTSRVAQIKFFLTKSFFSANFYYALYLFVFLLLSREVSLYFFIVYAGLDAMMSMVRASRVLFRKYD